MEPTVNRPGNGRSPLILLIGFVLLGIAAALLIFGEALFGNQSAGFDPSAPVATSSLSQIANPASLTGNVVPLAHDNGFLQVGDTASDFTLKDVLGHEVSLSDFAEVPVIINFWATWCGPCRVEMPELQKAYLQNSDNGLMILAIDQQESSDEVQKFFYDEMGLTFTPLLDSDGAVAEQYGVFNFPTSFFVARDGRVTAVHRGPMIESQIETYLADILTK